MRHLFVDSNGTYNTGTDEAPIIATGIFFKELDRDVDAVDDLFNYFKHVK